MAELNRPVLRWGILGGGKIAHDWIRALDHTQRPHKVVAVAASSSERAQKLISDCNLKDVKAYGGYEAILKDPDVDIVYIALHNEAHCPWSAKALEAGKHVLTEKPMGVNANEARATIELAKKKGLFFMEGFWSRWFPVWQQIRKTVDTKELGLPKIVHSVFGYPHEDNWRCPERAESPLTLYALYTIMFAHWVFGRKAEKIHVTGAKDKSGADDWASIVLEFGDDTRGICYYDSRTFLPQNGFVSFEKGQIQSNVMSFKDTLEVLEMIDEVRRQLGVEFPHDKKKY